MTDAPKRGRPRKERYALLMGGLWRNPKIRRLSNEALGVVVRAWSYASDQMTDGVIPVEMLEMWARPKRWPAIREELTRGSDVDGDRPLFVIDATETDARANGWLDVNISSAAWEKKLDADRSRHRKRGDFPIGNPSGNGDGNPSGNPAHFQHGAPDEDEDEEEISDRTPSLETGRAPAPAPAASARALTFTSDDDTGIGRFAQLALDEALRNAKPAGAYVYCDGDAGHLRTVADSANTCRGKRPLREVLDAWARDFVQEFRVRTAKNFATFAQARAANGGAKVRTPSPTDRREDHTPVAGSKPDRFDAEARERDEAARRAKAEAAPMPASIAALTAGIGKPPASKATPAPVAHRDPKPENVIEGEPPPELHDVAQALGRAGRHPIVVRGQRTTPLEIAAALPLPALRRARDTIAARQLSEMDAIEVLTGASA